LTGTAPDHSPKVSARAIIADPAVRVVLMMVFVIMLGFGLIAPILPLYARSFGVSYETASLLISAFAFARLIFDPIAGPIVDRIGERLSATLGVTFVGVTAVLAGLAPNFPLAVLFRGAGGAGSSVFFAALYSYLLKVVPSDRMGRTLSLLYGSLNVGIIAGGPLGGVIAHFWGLASPLFVYAGLCLVSGVLHLRLLRDPRPTAAGRSAHPSPGTEEEQDEGGNGAGGSETAGSGWRRTSRQIRELLAMPAFVTVIVLNMAFFWVVAGGYDTLVPLFAREGLGMSPVGVGGIFAIVVLSEFVVLYPAGSAADRIGRKPVLGVSMAWLAVMIVFTGWARSPFSLGVAMGLLGLASGSAAASPAAMLSDIVGGKGSGTAVGVFRFAGDLGFVCGPLMAGVAANHFGFRGAFALMSAPVLVALVLILRTPETLRRRRPDALASEPQLG
jgi:DHA1 family multidrug resistance protein-like MFS transporter